ncbi:MAG: DUF1345 domain-containing protein [Desulfobaccales bacterium]
MTFKKRVGHFAWELHDQYRAVLALFLGAVAALICWERFGFSGKVAFLLGWILALNIYLGLLGIVIFQADGPMTKQRVSRDEPNRVFLLIVLILVALLGNISVGVILTSVGNEHPTHARRLVALSVWAVVMSWFLLHTAVGQHYARLYYEDTDRHGRLFAGGMRQGFTFPGSPEPTYLDFLYVSFTVGLTYAMSDVNVTNEVQRRMVLIHSVISFFFYSTILGGVLNAIVTS